jgi:signal transduction histidine kinase/DNA-binding response OmpR family regulator
MHKLLERQLKKYFPEKLPEMLENKSFSGFFSAIDSAYVSYDDDRQLLERSLELSSKELNEKNQDLRLAQILAETASKAKTSFLANMSHEMRTPLNAIIGYSELLLEELAELNHEEIAVELDKIRTAGNHLLGLINNVLDLAKIESGHMDVNLEEFDVLGLVKETCTILQSQALKNKNKLGFESDASVTKVTSDRAKVKQILINLTGNALKFTKDGQVSLKVSQPSAGRMSVCVQDTGIGMSPEKLVKLFQPFVQAESETQKKFGGTGLGLAISKKFAELLDASISVESKEGVGTQFTLTLNTRVRLEHGNTSLANLEGKLPDTGERQTNNRILVVDDDPNAVDLMRRFLGRQGFECISLKSGINAIEEAIRIKPAAVLLDVFMPGIDGWTILSRLKQNAETAAIPVIFTTMTDERSLGLSLGAVDYFTKPIDWSRLGSVLKSIEGRKEKSIALLTEAESAAQHNLVRFFVSTGWEVVEASDTESFRKKLSAQTFDLVILDCLNPKLDTLACIESLRECKMNLTTPVICCTDSQHFPCSTDLLKGRIKLVVDDAQSDGGKLEQSIVELVANSRKVNLK